ncbi:MAG: GGDEF domain-containing protein [Dehalococcoidia bacterium]|nr:GGDEF domain-containing protein [Dehalococcoidia bacterium]
MKYKNTSTEELWTNTTVLRDLTLISITAIFVLALSSALRKWRELRHEIALHKRTEETIKQLAYHDSLTGLPNRRLFIDRLNMAIAHAERNKHKLAMILLDLDQFKDVNDALGHSVGDELLQVVGERLANLLRKSDTVDRMGGDEFMLMLPAIARQEDAAMVAMKILEAFREPFVFDVHELRITTSIGIAIYPGDGEDADTLVKHADIAMYHAKNQGRDNYQCYTGKEEKIGRKS